MLCTLLKVAVLSGHHDLGYGLEMFDESPGICYESLGKAALYNTDWKAIVYLPLRPITSEITMIENYVDYIERLYSRADIRNWTACGHLDDRTSTRLRQVKVAGELVANIVGQRSNGSRRKRGIFDFVGMVSKDLFGMVDENDDQIEHFEQISDSLTHLLKQQLTVMRFTLGAVKETIRHGL